MVHQAQAQHEVAGELLMDRLQVRAGPGDVEHQRVVRIVDPNLKTKTQVPLAVRCAGSETIRGELGWPKLIQVDLRRLRTGARGNPHRRDQQHSNPTPIETSWAIAVPHAPPPISPNWQRAVAPVSAYIFTSSDRRVHFSAPGSVTPPARTPQFPGLGSWAPIPKPRSPAAVPIRNPTSSGSTS